MPDNPNYLVLNWDISCEYQSNEIKSGAQNTQTRFILQKFVTQIGPIRNITWNLLI